MQMNKIILFLNIPVIGGGSRCLIILASSFLPTKLWLKKICAFSVSSVAKEENNIQGSFRGLSSVYPLLELGYKSS